MKGLEKSIKVEVDRNGLIVIVGRLEEACSPDRILIPSDSHLATLLVLDAHEKVKHFGTAATLAELCSRFLDLSGQTVCKKGLKVLLLCVQRLIVSRIGHRLKDRYRSSEYPIKFKHLKMLISLIWDPCILEKKVLV